MLATAKRLIGRHADAPVDDYRETLDALRELIVSPTTAARQRAIAQCAASVGPDFELHIGHHLGQIHAATDT